MNRARDLKNLQALQFALHETVLYLDAHPYCVQAMEYYKDIQSKAKAAYDDFTSKYGPLTAFEVKGDNWSWINQPWPWEGEQYVDLR
jgi:spore coat protein JB